MKRWLAAFGAAIVLVTSAAAQGTPYIIINMPLPGAVIPAPEGGVAINGTAGNLNDVITVQALSATNQVVAQTTTNAPSGEGGWAVTMPVPYTGQGRIVVFSGNRQTGSVDAQAEVSVTFGTPVPIASPQPPIIEQPIASPNPPTLVPTQPIATPMPPRIPSISITSPPNGGTANVTSGTLSVTGTATNVFENNVIVQVRDAFSRVLLQTATTANASGAWATAFNMLIANGTTGSIRAFSQSPADGSVMTEAIVNVTFSSNCTPRTDWPVYTVQPGDSLFSIATMTGSTTAELAAANCLTNPNIIFTGTQLRVPRLPGVTTPVPAVPLTLTIQSPAPNTSVASGPSLLVTGSTSGTAVGNTSVRAIDPTGAVLAESQATVMQNPQNGVWSWQVNLDSSGIPDGTRLTLFAYAINSTNGAILVAAANPVVYGTNFAAQPFITITSPLPYTQINDAARTINITGRGGNLNDVITVQAVNDNGDVMATTTTNNPQGADGEWAASLQVPETRRGRIVAFSGNNNTQSIDALASIDVIFGNPTLASTFVLLNTPLPQTQITAASPYVVVAGSARGVFSDRVLVNVLDENGLILLSAPAQVNLNAGTWTLTTTANANIRAQRHLSIQVIATTPDGGVLAADRVQIVTVP